jgi:ribonuclease BN (tRNA processing enzyme)
MQLTLLGTGAPLHPTRAGTGMVVTAPGCQPLLIDTCGGLELYRALAAAKIELRSLRNVAVTHRHMDHTGGMQALLLARVSLDIHASADTHEGIRQMTAGCFPEWEQHAEVVRHIVGPGRAYNIGGFDVGFFEVDHRVPTLAVRVSSGGRTFAFSADCRPCPGAVAAAEEADLFLCDAICAEADGPAAAAHAVRLKHPTAKEAAVMARDARARRLLLTHIGRFGNGGDPGTILMEARASFAGPVDVAEDRAVYDV